MALSTIDLVGEVGDDRNNVKLVLKEISSARKTQGHKHARVLSRVQKPHHTRLLMARDLDTLQDLIRSGRLSGIL